MSIRTTLALGTALVLAAAYLIPDHAAQPAQPAQPGAGAEPSIIDALPGRPARVAGVPAAAPQPGPVATETPGCTVVENFVANADGTATPLISCESAEPEPPHPYSGYSSDALASLAYADADAARILGMRLRHDDQTAALSLIVRASALAGGDPAPLMEYANAYPQPSAIDGLPVRKTVHVQFVLGTVAELLEAGSSNVAYWEAQIREASADPDREIELLRQQALTIVAEMRRIRLDVTGTADFGGPDDA